MGAPNFTLLDSSLPEIGRLISAMLQARDAAERRSWTSRSQARAAHRSSSQASVLSARRREARDHTCRVQQVRLAGRLFPRGPHRLSRCRLRDAQPTQSSRRTELQ